MNPDWVGRVHSALLREDRAELARLFAEAEAAEGGHAASRSWLEAVSAYDADAVTG